MEKLSELKAILSKELNWHKSRIDCLFQMLVALISVRTVNLQELAVAMTNKRSLVKSRKKRLYRFFAKFTINYDVIALWIISLFFPGKNKFYIAIDRTNWFWGKSPINIFMASICYEGIAIPLLWSVLDKDGSSSAQEQIALVKRIKVLFGQVCSHF